VIDMAVDITSIIAVLAVIATSIFGILEFVYRIAFKKVVDSRNGLYRRIEIERRALLTQDLEKHEKRLLLSVLDLTELERYLKKIETTFLRLTIFLIFFILSLATMIAELTYPEIVNAMSSNSNTLNIYGLIFLITFMAVVGLGIGLASSASVFLKTYRIVDASEDENSKLATLAYRVYQRQS
jgi:hypothetical protein